MHLPVPLKAWGPVEAMFPGMCQVRAVLPLWGLIYAKEGFNAPKDSQAMKSKVILPVLAEPL